MKFKSLSTQSYSDYEKEIRDYWNEVDLLHESVNEREGCEPFVFYEGPPTANGKPGIHHVISRTLKDYVCRYKTMQGYQVKRKAGWDTHGLPVEIEVEKRLGLKSKKDIEEYGIKEFNEKCRESVFEYEELWRDMTERMAYLIDLENPYITLDNNYIESLWWILDKYNKEGLIYEGHKILPYCPRCGTGLASHEVAQGYKDIKSNTLYVKFKVKGKDNEYFLAWTTTPWTLVSNVCVTVSPDETYIRAKQNDEIYYLSKTLAPSVLGEDYEILEEIAGKDLEFMEYEQLMPILETDKKAFYVTLGDYVTTEDGTGIVHSAPAFGEDDYNTGKKYGLPVFNPVDEEGKYIGTPWAGRFVMEEGLDVDIIKYLAQRNSIYRKEKIEHSYPHCWRCQTPLLYYAKPSYYIEVTKYKDTLVECNKKVNWFPPHVGEKRFGNWLENLNDWAISRSRYWGTPLNIWVCENGHKDSIGSRAELAERAIEKVDPSTVELHRPYVDDIHITCKKCGGVMTRVKDVIDCWFDSGAMPFAQHHYPFENKENFDELFPADYICEGIDQTRGWFYSLLAVSGFVMGTSPYKNVLVNDLILDKDGKKMSKSRGNTVDPFDMFEQYGADTLRWYLLYTSPPWVPTRFDIEGLKEVQSKFFGTLKNVYNFFTLYANTDNINPKEFFVPYDERPELDRWILSKYNNLVRSVTQELDNYEVTKSVRLIQDFVNTDLSNWYIRRSRRRFWNSELTVDKKSVYNTTFEMLVGLSQMAAPFAPYLSEEMYRNLTGEKSVHLSRYPVANPELIDNDLEYRMDLAKDFVTLGRSSRENAKIKVRQPISKVFIDRRFEASMGYLEPLIREELNVKSVEYSDDLAEYVDYTLKPNFTVLGKLLGPKLKTFTEELNKLKPSETIKLLEKGECVMIELDGEEFEIREEHVITNISPKQGFNVETQGDLCIILDMELSEDLLDEGFAREFVSRIQQMRKQHDYEMMDNIEIHYRASERLTQAIKKFADYIKDETLAVGLYDELTENMVQDKLNGEEIQFIIKKK